MRGTPTCMLTMALAERKRVRARTTPDSAKKRTRANRDKLIPEIRIGQA